MEKTPEIGGSYEMRNDEHVYTVITKADREATD